MGVQPIRKIVTPEIPDKLYFRIGDVARICEVPAYVLRFWETEFPQLKPNKGGTGQRLYRKRDVEMALRIKSLLYDQGYTIPGARQVFKNEVKARESAAADPFVPMSAEALSSPAQAVELSPEPAASPEIQTSALPVPNPAAAAAALRQQARLRALRAEMQSLLDLLSASPVRSSTVAEPKPMRPRLVLEPRPATPRAEATPRPETLRLVHDVRNQGDLFGAE